MAKLKQEVPGCLRTLTGARQVLRDTQLPIHRAKHGLSFADALVMLTENLPWMPAAAGMVNAMGLRLALHGAGKASAGNPATSRCRSASGKTNMPGRRTPCADVSSP